MDQRTVFIVILASVLLLIGLGVVLSFAFAGISPDFSFFIGGNVAVIELKGSISNDSGLFGASSTAEDIAELIEKAEEDSSIKGIFLEINSGGGSVVATKQIVSALRKSEKPKVAYISDMGASGAYYSAAACDYIIADEDSLTGSLGAISIILDLSQLQEKHGIGAETIAAGEHKGMGDPFSELDEEEREIMQDIVDQAWQGFRSAVIEFRGEKLDKSKYGEMFDGRVMSGRTALEYGLIDQTGSKKDAVKKIGELVGVEEPTLKNYMPSRSLFSMLSTMGYSFGQGFKQSLSSSDISLNS